MNVREEWRTAERSCPVALFPLCSKIQKLNIMRQHIRILQCVAPRLPVQGFLDLKYVTIDAVIFTGTSRSCSLGRRREMLMRMPGSLW